MFETRQFHVLWDVTPRKLWSRKPRIDEKQFFNILGEHVKKKPFKLFWVQAYIKHETCPGDLCLILLQKNVKGCHVDPKKGKLDSKNNVLFYREVQKKMRTRVFEGHNFQLVYPEPVKFTEKDRLNVDLKASNSCWRPLTVEFLWTLGYSMS